MVKYYRHIFILFLFVQALSQVGFSQISPGELAKVHAHLEGMSNCTQCHSLGAKVSNEKCLDCHKEVKTGCDPLTVRFPEFQSGFESVSPNSMILWRSENTWLILSLI